MVVPFRDEWFGYISNLTFLQRLFLLTHPIPYNLFGLYYWYKAVDPDCNQYYHCFSYMGTCSPVIVATAIGIAYKDHDDLLCTSGTVQKGCMAWNVQAERAFVRK